MVVKDYAVLVVGQFEKISACGPRPDRVSWAPMSEDRPERPSDPNRLAASIVGEATGETLVTREEAEQALERLERAARASGDMERLADLAIIRDWLLGKGSSGARVLGLAPPGGAR